MKKKSSSTKKCSCPIVTTVALAITLFVFDSIFHGVLLEKSYMQTASLWRSKQDMGDYLFFNIAMYLISSGLIVAIFKQFILNLNKKELLNNCFKGGLLLGFLVGTVLLGFYAYMPISLDLAIAWFFAGVAHGVLIAVILYLFNKNK